MGTGYNVREMTKADRDAWFAMYRAIFPNDPERGLNKEISRVLDDPQRLGVMCETGGDAVGFAELSIRPFANGCRSHPVPFLEAIWVDPAHRRGGAGNELLTYLEGYARNRGFREIGSDVLQDNALGLSVHGRWGFEETERVVYFRKSL